MEYTQVQEDIEKNEPDRFESFWKTSHLFKLDSGESFVEVQK